MGISVSYPLPGTIFHDMVKKDLKEKANWTDSDELALMFKNTYPPEYYKSLHRYLHKKFRKRQGMQRLKGFITNPVRNYHGLPRTILATTYYIPATIYYKLRMAQDE